MQDKSFELEKQEQFRRDKAAFESLPDWQKTLADRLASAGITGRSALIGVARVITNVLGAALYLLEAPYRFIWTAVRRTADGVVRTIKGCFGAGAAVARGALSVLGAGLGAIGGAAKFLARIRLLPRGSALRFGNAVTRTRARLSRARVRVAEWASNAKAAIELGWRGMKDRLAATRARVGAAIEYYGAIGLYRATKWILDPRTKSGRPLLGFEFLNKLAGIGVAAIAFTLLSYGLGHLAVAAKIWHATLAASFFTDASPLLWKLGKQALLHPAITVGVTGVKFLITPAIAATRHTLKGTSFTQAVAYAYNASLNERSHKLDLRRTSEALEHLAATQRQRTSVRGPSPRHSRRNPMGDAVDRVASHLVHAVSPEHYEARHKHYQRLSAQSSFRAVVDDSGGQAPLAHPAVQSRTGVRHFAPPG